MGNNDGRDESKMTRGGRVGRFHFTMIRQEEDDRKRPARYRLMAVLFNGQSALIRLGRTIDELWQRPLPIAPEIEAALLDLRVERWVGGLLNGEWEPLESRRRSKGNGSHRDKRFD